MRYIAFYRCEERMHGSSSDGVLPCGATVAIVQRDDIAEGFIVKMGKEYKRRCADGIMRRESTDKLQRSPFGNQLIVARGDCGNARDRAVRIHTKKRE